MLIKDTDTHERGIQKPAAKNDIFVIRGSQNVNPSKSLFRKFDPKTKLSLPCMGNREICFNCLISNNFLITMIINLSNLGSDW